MTHRRSSLYVLVGMLLVSLLITSCGGAGALTAEEVHTQYVQALVTNDRQALRRLTVTEEHIMVDDTLSTFQDIIAGQGGSRGYGATQGTFVEAAPLVLTDEGQGKVGISLWRWEHRVDCYQVQLAQTDSGWHVTKWYHASRDQMRAHPHERCFAIYVPVKRHHSLTHC